jgi:ATP phosphoribosyltransferase
MEDNIGAEQYVAAYKKIREAIKEKESAFKQEIADLKEKQQILSTKLLEFCNEHNLDSIKTSEGTVSRRVITKFWCSDWDQMHTFIKENDAMHLLEARLHQANLKQFLQDNPDKMPIGLQSNSEYAVSVRKRS